MLKPIRTIYIIIVSIIMWSCLQSLDTPASTDASLVAEHIAYVRYCPDDRLCDNEYQFLRNRMAHMHNTISTTDIYLPTNIPRIALCFSGGGFRALFLVLGFLNAASQTGLLDMVTYISCLSGSTWAVAPWMATQQTIGQVISDLYTNANAGMSQIHNIGKIRCILALFLIKSLSKKFIPTMQLYGNLLADTLLKSFGPAASTITISQTHHYLLTGNRPLPIYTAIDAHHTPYSWIEITPFEVGSHENHMYIPTWACGRTFAHGTSTNHDSELPLSYLLALFGSAFQANINDLIRHQIIDFKTVQPYVPLFLHAPVKKIAHQILNTGLQSVRLLAQTIKNYTYLMDQSRIKNAQYMSLIDAGIDFNIPIPPLLRSARHVDIMIIYDCSTVVGDKTELEKAAEYAHRNDLKFPPINYHKARTQPMSVFKDKHDPACPIVIYFPLIRHNEYDPEFDPMYQATQGFCQSFNFSYSTQQMSKLTGLSNHILTQHASEIIQIIQTL